MAVSCMGNSIGPVVLTDTKCDPWLFSYLLALQVLVCKQVYSEVRKQDYITANLKQILAVQLF